MCSMTLRSSAAPKAPIKILALLNVADRLLNVEYFELLQLRERGDSTIDEPGVSFAESVARERAVGVLQ